MVNGASPGPAPADQARASSSRLTRSNWRTWPRRCAARRRRRCSLLRPAQKPPASSPCRRCWLGLGRDPGPGAGQPVRAGPDAGPAWLAGSARHWPPGGGRRRRRGCGRAAQMLASFGCSSFRVGLVSAKPLSPKPGALSCHFSTPLLLSLRWIGAKLQWDIGLLQQLGRAPYAELQHSEG